MSPSLLSPVTVGDLSLPNRVAMAPMTRGRAEGDTDWVPSEAMAEYYAQRASAGLIITEGTATSELGEGWWRAPRIFSKKHAAAWKKVTDAVHAKGGLIFCQLWHTGRNTHSSFRPNAKDGRGVAPSPIKQGGGHRLFAPVGMADHEEPRALTTEECEAIPNEYAIAARCAKEAGFDGVEIHSANGYLLDEFLQSTTNVRSDKYGGSIENRTRLLLDVVEAVTGVWPADRVAVRLSPNGMFNGMGCPEFRELFLHVAKSLDKFNLGYLHIMNGLGFGFHNLGKAMTLQEFRAVYNGKIMANCGYTKEMAEKDISEGNCDLVSFGRPFISNPDLVRRFEKNFELAPVPKSDVFYSAPGTNLGAKGLTDFPPAAAA